MSGDRAEIQLTDTVVGMFVFVALISVAPFFYTFIGMASGSADPFTALLMQLTVPLLFIALIVSLGVSASG